MPEEPSPVTSPVEIVNLALTGHLGARPLSSLDQADDPEGPDAAKLMRLLYANVRDELLTLQPWHFATRRVALALLADAPLYGYAHAYQLPQGGTPAQVTDPVPPAYCLRVLDTNLDPTWNLWWNAWPGWMPGTWPWPVVGVQGLWQVEGRTLISNEADLQIRYIAQIVDVSLYPAPFTAALAGLLASRAAYALTQNENTALRLEKTAERLVSRARSIEGQEGSQLQYLSTALTWDVR